MVKDKALRYACLITFLYDFWGTVTILSIYPTDKLYGSWAENSLLFTFPISVLSFGVRYAEKDSFWLVCLIQSAMFFPVCWIVYTLFFKRNRI